MDAVEESRQRIRNTLHVPQPLPSLDAEKHGEFRLAPDITVERVSYTTQLGMRVPAIVYRPSDSAPRRPALIIVNGHGGDKFAWYALYAGAAYARQGFVVLTYDPAGEGERNSQRLSGTRAHDRIVEPEEIGRWLGGLMICDVMQAVSYLASRPDVDPARIAAAGYSMGSFVLSLAGAIETRLKACLLTGGGNLDGPGGYWDRSKPMCQGIPYRSLSFLGDRAAQLYALHARRGPTFVYNGDQDTVVSMPNFGESFFADLRARVTRLLDGAGTPFEYAFVPTASHRPLVVTKPAALWLCTALQLPEPMRARIAALPVTRIAGWTADWNVPMDPLYATYDREGGTLGIGRAIPAADRRRLHVFPDAEWERRKDRLVHEAWLQRAAAQI